jgi:predicted CoA-substrate-specific enzyme activase
MHHFHALGVDVGSTTIKIVALDDKRNMAWHLLEDAEPLVEQQVERLLGRARHVNGSPEEIPLVATGYGRGLVQQATRQITEITCHARGIYQELGHGGTLVDIGGQDSKVIRISDQGEVIDFAMNDKCAAGTGRFLENMARRLKVPLDQMGQQALTASEEVTISSTCTVFAEAEVISLLAHGIAVAPILRGLHRALLQRIVAMIRMVGMVPPLMLSGGVVRNPAVAQMLAEEIGQEAILPRHPQLAGAFGAALMARSSLEKHSR